MACGTAKIFYPLNWPKIVFLIPLGAAAVSATGLTFIKHKIARLTTTSTSNNENVLI